MFQVNTKFTESLRDAIDIAYEQEPEPSNFFFAVTKLNLNKLECSSIQPSIMFVRGEAKAL